MLSRDSWMVGLGKSSRTSRESAIEPEFEGEQEELTWPMEW